jgi:predicted PhzF superfamily epimerase YddE/YHI9
VEAQLTDLYLDPAVKTIPLSFESKFSGKLGAALSKDTGRVALNFPSNPSHELNRKEHSSWIDEIIASTLGENVPPSFVCDVQYSPGTKILLLRLNNDVGIIAPGDLLRKVSPNFKKLVTINTGGFVRDIIVTVKGEAPPTTAGGSEEASKEIPHFYSRFFAPWDGVDEDPVCGTAHTVLTPYWTHELTKSLGGESVVGTLLGRQHSKRGGNLYCTLVADRVNLAGEARVTIKGHLFV